MNDFLLKLKHLLSLYIFRIEESGLKATPKDERDFKTSVLGWGEYKPKHSYHLIPTLSVKHQLFNTCSFNSATVQKEIDEGVVLEPRSIIAWAVKNNLVSGDGFADLRAAQKAMQEYGITQIDIAPRGEGMPWPGYSNLDLARFKLQAAEHKTKSFWFVDNRNDILKLLDENNILDTGLLWFSGFNQGGGFKEPWIITKSLGWSIGGHAIIIKGYIYDFVGVDKDYRIIQGKNGIDVYVHQNSYGKDWGGKILDDNGILHKGLFFSAMDYFDKNDIYGTIANLDIDKLDAKLINSNDVIIKKKTDSALYLACGTVLVPFSTWESFEPDFGVFKIIELDDSQFAKYIISKNSIIRSV